MITLVLRKGPGIVKLGMDTWATERGRRRTLLHTIRLLVFSQFGVKLPLKAFGDGPVAIQAASYIGAKPYGAGRAHSGPSDC